MSDSEWVLAENVASEPGEAEVLLAKWHEVAEDMALVPELNVRVREEDGRVRVEVSQELYDCMSGF
ncbi:MULTISPECIES: hypothetical protein [Desulfovibrio]|jgi:hypothetical protein|uniref:hypothetical protein n=1 Tax=Desulfovibrio TaxID=872 RepID=UPI0004161A02|nr:MULTISPECIES: hypothetical protein [Desulfovibrio]MDY0307157.1 hypothetical protein [Desulfovibrionaceae bacterium]HMM37661.1 hypothetical protein [Desulfovibrio sp.]